MRNFQIIHDRILGDLYFPKNDQVMAPTIQKNGIWEPKEFLWLQQNVKLGDKCLNIGANIGYFSILMSSLVGVNGTVDAFEPNRELVSFFNQNILERDIKNITLHPIAIGSENKKMYFYRNRKNYGDGRMFDPRITKGGGDWQFFGFNKIPSRRKVRVLRIDDLELGSVDVVLIDTQGFDHYVIRGMKNTFNSKLPKILTEFVPEWISDQGEDPVDILKEYKSYGYKVESIDHEELNKLNEKSFVEGILKSGTYFTNLQLLPD
jgi:FkbM family methyltransferase